MLTLTLRSGRDGRFLARVVDRDGFAFVLDYGDRRIIQDASQRLLKGFTMWRHGQLVTAGPDNPDLIGLMAEFYVNEGLLVFLEEPTWAGRAQSLEERLPGWSGAVHDLEQTGPIPLRPIPEEALGDLGDEDLTTEIRPAPDDDPTEIAPGPDDPTEIAE